MENFKKNIRNYVAIRLLTVYEICLIIFSIIFFIYCGYVPLFMIVIFLLLFSFFIAQLLLYLLPNGYLEFDDKGINIKSKRIVRKINWMDVCEFYFNSFDVSNLFFLRYNTIELSVIINDNKIDIIKEIGEITCKKKDYILIISKIPKEALVKNEFMIYSTILEKSKNKYNLK